MFSLTSVVQKVRLIPRLVRGTTTLTRWQCVLLCDEPSNAKLQRAEKRSILGVFPEKIAELLLSRTSLQRKETDTVRDGLWLCMIHALEASVDGYD